MFRVSELNKQIQAIVLLIALVFQSVLPAWHYGQHGTDAVALQESRQLGSALSSLITDCHQNEDVCLVCQFLTRDNHPVLAKATDNLWSLFTPSEEYPCLDEHPFVRLALSLPSPRAPPFIS